MSRYLKRLWLFLWIQALIAVLTWSTTRPPRSDHYLASLADKHEALLHRPGPRLILVGGSSAAFGICSPKLKEQLQVEPINMGVHAAMGLEFMLSHVERHVQSGDTVLLSPETHLLCAPLLPEQRFVDELLSVWPLAADYLPAECLPPGYTRPTWKDYFDHRALQEFGERFHHLRRNVSRMARGRPLKSSDNLYVRAAFNQYGDVVAHYAQPSKPFPLESIVYQKPRVDAAIERINRFADLCQQRGARVYFAYSPIWDDALAASQPAIQAVHERLIAELQIPVLMEPGESALPRSEFFDTHLHLTGHGARIRTQQLIQHLRPHVSIAARPSHTGRL